ncbi:hypothetical protein RR46_08657 [Papilio xuthus]|uniref:Uncharacterized protein n=1 Tax=Papilio xuthus TaxID=66420 RepID=A0A194Q9F0_PAPXU|nr:hypothetical protein RR46_08657 [Papilio xuthus]
MSKPKQLARLTILVSQIKKSAGIYEWNVRVMAVQASRLAVRY